MSYLERVRNQPKEKRIRLIWMWTAVAVVILLVLWIVSAQVVRHEKRDTTLFETVGHGINEVKDYYK